MCNCSPGRHHVFTAVFSALIVALYLLIIPYGKCGGFGESPAQVAIAIFPVTAAFFLAVAEVRTAYTRQ